MRNIAEQEDFIARTIVQAVQHYGTRNQVVVAIEELSELQKELCKTLRGEDRRKEIIEELADVSFMLPQIYAIFDITPEDVHAVEYAKAQRLAARIKAEVKK